MAETIILTGGNGFVGQHLTAELVTARPASQLVIWDQIKRSDSPSVEQVVIDITDPSSYRDSLVHHKPSWVIHLAALAAVGESFKNPEKVRLINTIATQKLLETIVQESPATKVLVVSTADIYGTVAGAAAGQPITERPLEEAQPVSPYAQSKWAMEQIIEKQFSDRVIRVRPFPHIGPGQGRGFVTADFAFQIAAIEAGQQSPVIKVGNLQAERDFTDVRDVVRAYRLLLEGGQVGEVYHVASGQAVSIQMILDQLLQLSATSITVDIDPTLVRPVEILRLVGNADKLRQATGWEPKISLKQSLQDILDDWRARV